MGVSYIILMYYLNYKHVCRANRFTARCYSSRYFLAYFWVEETGGYLCKNNHHYCPWCEWAFIHKPPNIILTVLFCPVKNQLSDETVPKAWSKWSHGVKLRAAEVKAGHYWTCDLSKQQRYKSTRWTWSGWNMRKSQTYPSSEWRSKQTLNKDGEERLNRSTWRPHETWSTVQSMWILILLFFVYSVTKYIYFK